MEDYSTLQKERKELRRQIKSLEKELVSEIKHVKDNIVPLTVNSVLKSETGISKVIKGEISRAKKTSVNKEPGLSNLISNALDLIYADRLRRATRRNFFSAIQLYTVYHLTHFFQDKMYNWLESKKKNSSE